MGKLKTMSKEIGSEISEFMEENGVELNPYTHKEYLKKYGENYIILTKDKVSIAGLHISLASGLNKIKYDYLKEIKPIGEGVSLKHKIKTAKNNEKLELYKKLLRYKRLIKKHKLIHAKLSSLLKEYDFIEINHDSDKAINWVRSWGLNYVMVYTLQVR